MFDVKSINVARCVSVCVCVRASECNACESKLDGHCYFDKAHVSHEKKKEKNCARMKNEYVFMYEKYQHRHQRQRHHHHHRRTSIQF